MRRKGTSALLAGAAPFLATVPAEGGPEWPISLLTSNGRRAVAGHTTRHERYDNDYCTGIRNIAFDSMAGFNAAVFIRTAKLKAYPRNADLRLGVASLAKATSNPVAGFIDPPGCLIWSALSDQSGFPSRYGDHWQLDRMANITPMQGEE